MKKTLLFFFALTLGVNVFGQTTNNKIYDSSPTGVTNDDYLVDAIATADGGMAALGVVYDATLGSSAEVVYLTKTDANGNILWSYGWEPHVGAWENYIEVSSVCQGSDGYFYVLGLYKY